MSTEVAVIVLVGIIVALAYGVIHYRDKAKNAKDKAYADMHSRVGGGAYNRDGGLRGDREPPRK